MYIPAKLWSCLSYLTDVLTLSAVDQGSAQQAIGGHSIRVRPPTEIQIDSQASAKLGHPRFHPPGWRYEPDGSGEFECDYKAMGKDWSPCSSNDDRGCWLRHKNGTEFNITTDYEKYMPQGKIRNIFLNVSDGTVNADGRVFNYAKLVNGSYPGPIIQGCWGDTFNITVYNNMTFNGTAIHWHGIRQLNSMEADGVPGITQCPIAPNSSYTYTFDARQYGSAWYHSHYSVQYADGLLGPLNIYGPHSSAWDEAKYPLMMNDWFHNSAYQVIHGTVPGYPTVVLNGTGDITKYGYMSWPENQNTGQNAGPLKNSSSIPAKYRLHFDGTPIPTSNGKTRAKRYLLRLINASFSTGFVFSIDHHKLKVISADFVQIEPFTTTHLHVGIGQRYNVIVEAQPEDYPDGTQGTRRKLFSIRTTYANCFRDIGLKGGIDGYDKTGVLSYYEKDGYDPKDDPGTKRWPQIDGDTGCRDEDRSLLKPKVPWKVGLPINQEPAYYHSSADVHVDDTAYLGHGMWNMTPGERFDVVGSFMLRGLKAPAFRPDFPVATFSFERTQSETESFEPMQINYTDPLLLKLGEKSSTWPSRYGVVEEDVPAETWVWLALGGRIGSSGADLGLINTAGAHPIHLHGHDFAILQQEDNLELSAENININEETLINPPRRDVVLLPASGFVVIAFKADNPGSWIMHCHIAFHASEGLALQFLERQPDAFKRWNGTDPASVVSRQVCKEWKAWEDDCTKHYPGYNKDFQCYSACNGKPDRDPKTGRKYACKNLLYDDSGI